MKTLDGTCSACGNPLVQIVENNEPEDKIVRTYHPNAVFPLGIPTCPVISFRPGNGGRGVPNEVFVPLVKNRVFELVDMLEREGWVDEFPVQILVGNPDGPRLSQETTLGALREAVRRA